MKHQEETNDANAQGHAEHENEQRGHDVVLLPTPNAGREFAQHNGDRRHRVHWMKLIVNSFARNSKTFLFLITASKFSATLVFLATLTAFAAAFFAQFTARSTLPLAVAGSPRS